MSEANDPLRKQTQEDTQDIIYAKRDPEEEFFMLSVLAIKMLHTEQYEDTEYIYSVQAEEMFKTVKDSNMQFHRWYKWLESQFEERRLDGLSPYCPPSDQKNKKTPSKQQPQ